KNFEALIELLRDYPEMILFCSDDKHPDSLVLGHINQLCARAVAKGIDLFHILKAACSNPVNHYKLDVGLLRTGDPADFICVKNLEEFIVTKTYINGQLVAKDGQSLIKTTTAGIVNNFSCSLKTPADFAVKADGADQQTIPVIEALDGQLITNRLNESALIADGYIKADTARDILKIVVVNRYNDAPVSKAFIRNFGLRQGAIASSVAHDSHNIVAVGADDESICAAVNAVIDAKGGVSIAQPAEQTEVLPLPVAGLMSQTDGYEVAEAYARIDRAAKKAGSTLGSPFMTLSFMALLVIPHLKLSDKGLFDGDRFSFVS
ncbi:MAG: adenine deaminase, partial [Chitinophagaceae bacterium]|nr:adenine deaminase [Chitinophagaceae bacterium]